MLAYGKNSIKRTGVYEVWNVNTEGKTDEEIALEGIRCLEDFEKEIGMPTSLSEMNITDKEIL